MKGWIKLHRQILDNPIVCKDSDYFAMWGYLILNATHQEREVLFAGKKIVLKNGQLITGRKAISAQFNISESKVQRALKVFENEHQIEQQASNRNRLITILNWEKYQSCEQQDEQQMNINRTSTEHPLNTNKNVKNIKNDKNDKKDINDFFETIWKLYPKKRGKSAIKNTRKKELYKVGYDDISKAIKNYKKEIKGKDEQYILNGSTFFNGRYKDYIDMESINLEEEIEDCDESEYL